MNKYTVLIVINIVCYASGRQNAVVGAGAVQQEQYGQPLSPYPDYLNQQPVLASFTHVTKPGTRRPVTTYSSTQTLSRPTEQHALTRPRPVFDADVHFDEDVHYNIYRPMTEHNGFPHIIGDHHMIPRPPNKDEHVTNNFANHGNIHFPNQYGGQIQAITLNKPNSNTHQSQVLIRPEHFSPLPIRPLFPFQPDHAFHGGYNGRPLDTPSMVGRPFNTIPKPQLVIFSKNVVINPPNRDHHPNLNFVSGPISAIRFDHGRDHHIRPNIAPDNIDLLLDIPKTQLLNKDVFNNIPKKDAVSKPNPSPTDQTSAMYNPGNNEPVQPSDLHRPEVGDTSTVISKPSHKQEGMFHPLLAPMTTKTP